MQQWHNNRPTRSQLRRIRSTLVGLMLLAWSTQLLITQWASGSEPSWTGVQLQMRDAVEVSGDRVRLGDVCHLSFEGPELLLPDGRPLAQLVLLTAAGEERLQVGVEQVVTALGQNGIHPVNIRFQGPVRCDVRLVPEAQVEQDLALLAWAGVTPAESAPPEAPASDDGVPQREVVAVSDWVPPGPRPLGGAMTLGEMLRLDLARQLQISPDNLILTFRSDDEPLAARSDIAPAQVRHLRGGDLGRVAWSVTADGREVALQAEATAYVSRARLINPLSRGQVIRQTDVTVEQVRINRLSDRGLTSAEAIGQEASRNMSVGELLTPDRLAPRMLVRRGQFVAIRLVRNGIELRSLGRALDDGAYGQVVRVRSETTGEVLNVTMTAPQAGVVSETGGVASVE